MRASRDTNVACATNNASTAFRCFTTTSVPAGEQLFVPYSSDPNGLSNARLLMDYGFAVLDNSAEEIHVELPPLRAPRKVYDTILRFSRLLSLPSMQR